MNGGSREEIVFQIFLNAPKSTPVSLLTCWSSGKNTRSKLCFIWRQNQIYWYFQRQFDYIQPIYSSFQTHLLIFRKEHRIHEWGSREEIMFQIVRYLAPPRQFQRFHSSILNIHVSVYTITNQSFHNCILWGFVEIIRVKLKEIISK